MKLILFIFCSSAVFAKSFISLMIHPDHEFSYYTMDDECPKPLELNFINNNKISANDYFMHSYNECVYKAKSISEDKTIVVGNQKVFISKNKLAKLLNNLVEFYEFQDSGVLTINDKYNFVGHADFNLRTIKNKKLHLSDFSGGWYDAGDYGKYVVSSSYSLWLLLDIFDSAISTEKEINFDQKKLKLVIRKQLNWMLKMQDMDGGVFEKVATMFFPSKAAPMFDLDQRFVYPPTIASTLSFAYVMFKASRFYQSVDTSYSEKLYKAADKALSYLKLNRNQHNKLNTYSGDNSTRDEILLTELEKFKTKYMFSKTRDEQATLVHRKLLDENIVYYPSWNNLVPLAFYSAYQTSLFYQYTIETHLKHSLSAYISKMENVRKNNPLDIPMAKEDYYWGSNSNLLNILYLYKMDYLINNNKNAISVIAKSLNYILGMNPLNKCFVTFPNEKCVIEPHHRYFNPNEHKMVSMLVGGPNQNQEDNFVYEVDKMKYPMLAYADIYDAYASNEVAITNNAILINILHFFLTYPEN